MSHCESAPELSVIVLTYNQVQYVERALESVLAIDGVDYEVVVSDDGSTDGTRRVLERIAERNAGRVRLLPEHSNYGIVRNYFYALAHCRGRYVTDVAGDDRRMSQSVLRRYVDLLDRTPGAVAVSSRWIHGGKLCGISADGHDNRTMMRRMLSLETPPPMMLSAMIYRRSALLECMERNRGVVCDAAFGCEDLPVILALLSNGAVLYDDVATVEYTPVENSVTATADNAARTAFAAGLCRCVSTLSAHYGFQDNGKVTSALRGMACYMLGCAAADGGRGTVDMSLAVCDSMELSLPLRGRVYKAMLRNRLGLRSIVWLKSVWSGVLKIFGH